MLVDDRDQQAAAPPAAPAVQARIFDDRNLPGTQPQMVDDRTSDWTDYLPTPKHALETVAGVGLPLAAGMVGGPGAAALTSMGVEAARQYVEGEPFNPQSMGVEGALALVPGGKAAESFVGNVVKRGIHGTVLGAAGEIPRELARSGQYPSMGQAAVAGGIGGLTGGVLGAGEHAVARLYGGPDTAKIVDDRAPEPPPQQVEAPPPPVAVQHPPQPANVPRETVPPPLAQTYGPAAPRTTGGQGEFFLPLTERPAVRSELPQEAPRPEVAPPPAQPPIVQPAPEAPATRSISDQAASPEAISRLGAERLQGIGYFRTRQRGGPVEPMPATVDRVDIQPRADEVIVKQNGDGTLSVDRTGPDVQPNRLPSVLKRVENQLPKAVVSEPAVSEPIRPMESRPPTPLEGPVGRPVGVFGLNDPTVEYPHQFRAVPLDSIRLDTDLQPRDVERATREASVNDLYQKLSTPAGRRRYFTGNQEMDRGVPIVSSEGEGLSGNTRLLAVRKLQAENPEAFRAFLSEQQAHAAEFGLRPEDLSGDTVAVRELTQPMSRDELRTFANEANGRASMGMAPAEEAGMDAGRLSPDDVRALKVNESETVDQALNAPKNRGVVQRFLETFPKNDRSTLGTKQGEQLNPTGLTRLKAALLAKTYTGEAGQRFVTAITETTDTGVKNLESGVFGSIAKMGNAMDLVRSGSLRGKDLDVAEDIAKAVEYIAQKRKAGTLPGQIPAFKSGLTPFQETLADHFEAISKSGVRVRRLINGMADAIIESPREGQRGLLGPMAAPTKESILENALTKAHEQGLFGDVGAIGRRPRRPTGRPGEKPNIGAEQPEEERAQNIAGMGLGKSGAGPKPPPVPGSSAIETPPGTQRGRLSAKNPDLLAESTRIQSPEEAGKLQDALATHFRDQIEYARRGKVPLEETRRQAQAILESAGTDEALARKRGQAVNAEQAQAMHEINKRQLATMSDAAEKAIRTGNEDDKLAFVSELYRTAGTAQQMAGATAEAGRTLRVFRAIKEDPRGAAASQAFAKFAKGGTLDEVIRAFQQYDPNDFPSKNRFAQSLVKATIWDKIQEFWTNGLLSGPQTHIVNTTSNAITALERPASLPFRVAADIIRAKATGTPRERFLGEAKADLYGMLMALRGVRAGLQEATTGSKIEGFRREAIGGRLGEIVRAPSKWLDITDNIAKAINSQGYLHARAYRQAMMEGRTGKAFNERVAEIVSRPDAIEGLRADIAREAKYRTFQLNESPFDRAIIQARNTAPYGIGHFIMPFVRTPMNIARFGIERSPLALIDILNRSARGTLRGSELSDAVAHMAIGTSLIAAMATLVKEGVVTGFGPADPQRRAAWRASGAQPYSFRVPEGIASQLGLKSQWINYGRLEPFGIVLGLGADLGELIDKTEPEDAVSKIGFAFGKNLTSKTFMKGVSGFFNAVDDPGNYGRQFVNDFAGTLVPQLVAQTSRAWDPVLRKPQTIRESIQSRLGLGAGIGAVGLDEVGPVRDLFGEEVMRVGGPVERAISPIYRSYTREEDPARAEVARLQLAVGSPRRQLAGVEMNRDEYDRYVEQSGELAHQLVSRLVSGGGYQRVDDSTKADLIHKAFLEARMAERGRMTREVIGRARYEGIMPKLKRAAAR